MKQNNQENISKKGALSPRIYYIHENRSAFKQVYPHFSQLEIDKILKEKYTKLKKEEKEHYEEKSLQEKARINELKRRQRKRKIKKKKI